MFEYTSKEFSTVTAMNKEKKELMNNWCDFIGVDRGSFRLQQGNITLKGKSATTGDWVNITSRITDFKTYLNWKKNFSSFKLYTKLEVKR